MLNFLSLQHSEDSWSEEEADIESDEDHRHSIRRKNRQSCSTLSSEGIFSEEEGMSTRGTPDPLATTYSSENLTMDLASCVSDGLSDREMTVKKMRVQVSQRSERRYEVSF